MYTTKLLVGELSERSGVTTREVGGFLLNDKINSSYIDLKRNLPKYYSGIVPLFKKFVRSLPPLNRSERFYSSYCLKLLSRKKRYLGRKWE